MTVVDSTRSRHSHRAADVSALDAPTVRIEVPRSRRESTGPAASMPAPRPVGPVGAVPAGAVPAGAFPAAFPAAGVPAPTAAAPKRRRWPWIVAAGVGGLIVIGTANGGSTPTPAASAPASPAASSPSAASPGSQPAAAAPAPAAAAAAAAPAAATPTTFSSGTYQVGTDLVPGRYKTAGGTFCGWSRDKADDGQLDSIIANDILQGPGSVTVKPTDKFVEFSGDCTWTKQ